MFLAAGFAPSFVLLVGLKSLALRRGVWFRVSPAARALIDAAILYLRRGGRIKSPALLEALRKAAEKVLTLATPVRVLAEAIGRLIAKRLGVEVDEERAVALGIQWLNTPKKWKSRLKLFTHM
jgi:choline dehydrogenase-like flavoprotein